VETARDDIRELILNKGVTTKELLKVGKKFHGRQTQLLAYVLLKPPFLNETEAIEDTISTIELSLEIGAAVVSIEAVSIQHFTTVSLLWEAGYYKPPWIWSIFEIVKRTAHLGITIRIGGFEFYPIPKEFTSNCSACNQEMINRINEFNSTNDLNVIENLKCSSKCDIKWKEELKDTDRRSLPGRVIEILESIEISGFLNRLPGRRIN
jgi:radical SAM enzyme (TIGR01210 family)